MGGLVFEPLTVNLLKEWDEWTTITLINLVNYYCHGEPEDDRREIIVLIKVLADEINVGYHDLEHNVISYVNGKKISTMKDLVDAFEEHEGKYHSIVDERGYKIVLDKSKVDENNQRILEKYKINSDRSKDLER